MTLGNGGIDFDSGGTGSSSTAYTDEEAVDAVGAALRSTSTVVAIYDDAANTISFTTLDVDYVVPKVTVLTATTTSVFTVTTGTQRIIVEGVAAGGGGGAVAGSSTSAAVGGGGGAGGYFRKFITSTATAYTYVVGAKGTGGSAGQNAGNAGNDTTFGAGGSLLTAKAGSGGNTQAVGTSVAFSGSGAGGAISTGGDVNAGGSDGEFGLRLSASATGLGGGGMSYFGGAGKRTTPGNNPGNAATGYGSGGSGARVESVNTPRAGGDGADGTIIVQEFVTE